MRFFIVALIIFNVAYFFYPAATQSLSQQTISRGDPGVPLLELIGESTSEQEVEGMTSVSPKVTDEGEKGHSPSGEGEDGDAVATDCYTIGPFRREERAEAATQALLAKGVKVKWRAAKERRTKGFAVYLPPYPSHEAAQRVVEKLSASGLTDYYILNDPKRNNAISLGFFTLKAGSEKRVSDLKAMGYSPQVEARFDEIPVYWLDYQVSKDADRIGLWSGYTLPSGVEILDRDCK